MKSNRIGRITVVLGLALGATILACSDSKKGGSNADGSTGNDDSSNQMDGPGSGSGSSGIQGLGQRCGSGFPTCPTNAPECISVKVGSGASPSYCTPHCLDNGSATTNAQGQISSTTPPPDTAKCTAAYTGGSVGNPACGLILSYQPMDNPLKPNKTYTQIVLGCIVACSMPGNTCPTGMTCNTGVTPAMCFPN